MRQQLNRTMSRNSAELSSGDHVAVERRSVDLGDTRLSYLEAGSGDPVLLLHGTFWSRVWQPVMPALGREVRAIALDFPGFGHSGGRLERDQATLPALAVLALRFAEAVDVHGPFGVAGHDIGGGVAQQLAVAEPRVGPVALVNSVLYDSWPVPAVARFSDPGVAASVTPEEMVAMRRESLRKAIARELTDVEANEYVEPWRDEDRIRSWAAMAAAADPRYTLGILPELKRLAPRVALIWGDQDEFQPIVYAERFERELPGAALVRIPGARHIPMEDAPDVVGDALVRHLVVDRG
jgi:pimeloyl-ACP methyl ester carboxylesterase